MRKDDLHIIIFILSAAILLFFAPIGKAKAQEAGWNVVALGDSNTSIGGDECNLERGWTYWFKQRVRPRSMRSYARSGATWTNTLRTRLDTESYTEVLADGNVVYNQVQRLMKACSQGSQPKPDIIIIAAGTNDAWFKQRRPGLFQKTAADAFQKTAAQIRAQKPSETLTLAESVRQNVELLIDAFPDARVILLTPMQTTKAPYTDTERVGDVIERVGQRMAVPVIRQDHITGVYREREAQKPRLTADGTHTSPEGARRNGLLLAKIVEGLMW